MAKENGKRDRNCHSKWNYWNLRLALKLRQGVEWDGEPRSSKNWRRRRRRDESGLSHSNVRRWNFGSDESKLLEDGWEEGGLEEGLKGEKVLK